MTISAIFLVLITCFTIGMIVFLGQLKIGEALLCGIAAILLIISAYIHYASQ